MACEQTALEIIAIRAPEYVEDPVSDRLLSLIELAECKTGKEFGKCYEEAVALRTLHWLAKSGVLNAEEIDSSDSNTGDVGVITSVKEGDNSISYGGSAVSGSSSSKYGDLSTTPWGQELIELMNSCIIPARTRLVGCATYPSYGCR